MDGHVSNVLVQQKVFQISVVAVPTLQFTPVFIKTLCCLIADHRVIFFQIFSITPCLHLFMCVYVCAKLLSKLATAPLRSFTTAYNQTPWVRFRCSNVIAKVVGKIASCNLWTGARQIHLVMSGCKVQGIVFSLISQLLEI